MIKITRFFYIHFLVLPLFILAYCVGALHTLIMAYCVVSVHELFHLFAALLLRVRTGSIIVTPFGMTLRLMDNIIKEPVKETLIALAGPFANVCMLCAGIILKKHYIWAEQSFFLFWYLNWIIMILNLLPVLPLDGGRVTRALLAHVFGYLTGMRIMRRLTMVISGILLAGGLLLLIVTHFNISLVMVAAFLFYNMAEEKRRGDILVMRELLRSKEKLLEERVINTKILAAAENTPAKKILRKLNYDRYHLIYVEKREGEGRFISESELIKAVLTRGYGLKMVQI